MQENFSRYLKEFRSDLPAGLVVFLVALPLCLGIALASGAPLFSGLITGVVGGIVVGLLSGSHLSVSGPAAGLTIIVLNAITELGSFEVFLLAVVLAGIIQLIMGYVKAGIIGLYFPSSVIKGMLAAIGLILILKQIPHFLGVDQEAFGSVEYDDGHGHNTFTNFFYSLQHIQPGAFLVGLLSLAILILWERPLMKKQKWAKIIPGALVAVVASVLINVGLKIVMPLWTIESSHLVNLPTLSGGGDGQSALIFPDFSAITNILVWKVAAIIAIIASLETLLSIEAVDKLDPHKRRTPQNRELKAQGVGNILAGLIGGLPMTAVIVRSTANLEAGSRTKMSAVYHGILLILSILLIPNLLNMIPLACLAAVLLLVGYKLAKPKLFKQQYQLGFDQFFPFMTTVVAILLTDLLIGILIGMAVGIFFILKANYKTPYFFHEEEYTTNGKQHITIMLSEHVSFINKASLQLTLEHLPHDCHVVIDGSRSQDIDYDALNIIHEFASVAHERNIEVTLKDVPQPSIH
ncbi:MAG TPA: SulP family inorganic anion transporter [Saprospiraceae bacterium]|nr:SulP family inorganic anion transporter [Saprospiraceae bacterium]